MNCLFFSSFLHFLLVYPSQKRECFVLFFFLLVANSFFPFFCFLHFLLVYPSQKRECFVLFPFLLVANSYDLVCEYVSLCVQ